MEQWSGRGLSRRGVGWETKNKMQRSCSLVHEYVQATLRRLVELCSRPLETQVQNRGGFVPSVGVLRIVIQGVL